MADKMPTTRDLDQRVKLYPPTETRNTLGEVVVSYPATPEAEVWAQVAELDGADLMRAQTFLSHLNVKIWIRFYPGLLSSYQVEWRDTRFNLTEVLPHGRMEFHSMVASEAK